LEGRVPFMVLPNFTLIFLICLHMSWHNFSYYLLLSWRNRQLKMERKRFEEERKAKGSGFDALAQR
jgi:hypothetical protein